MMIHIFGNGNNGLYDFTATFAKRHIKLGDTNANAVAAYRVFMGAVDFLNAEPAAVSVDIPATMQYGYGYGETVETVVTVKKTGEPGTVEITEASAA
ncbi:MAG: hypothetical protein J6X53_06770 [Abditibacteriota bacterium]|nr:hypothetical protein [Abditibacteriota bacterium]